MSRILTFSRIATTLIVSALLLGQFGCVQTEYVGKTYAPTESVELYFDMGDVSRPHEVMGQARAEATEYLSFEQIEQELIKQAMMRGADAIVIENMDTVAVGSTTSTSGEHTGEPHYYATTDGKLHKTHGSDKYREYSSTSVQRDKVITAKLVKFTD